MTTWGTSVKALIVVATMTCIGGCTFGTTQFRGYTTLGTKELQQCAPGATKVDVASPAASSAPSMPDTTAGSK